MLSVIGGAICTGWHCNPVRKWPGIGLILSVLRDSSPALVAVGDSGSSLFQVSTPFET